MTRMNRNVVKAAPRQPRGTLGHRPLAHFERLVEADGLEPSCFEPKLHSWFICSAVAGTRASFDTSWPIRTLAVSV